MNKCINHPKYNGIDAPDLSCKTCCTMFVNEIRRKQAGTFTVMNPPVVDPVKDNVIVFPIKRRFKNGN